jgi:hypothetical protein
MRLTVTARDDDFVAARFTGGETAQAVAMIEAAPDLLAALLEVVGEWDSSHADEDHRSGYTLDTGGISQARTAIARATGL